MTGGNDNRRMNQPPSIAGTVALTHWGVIRARGDDAASFLHSQLTNDFSALAPADARLAGYCSAKGRLLASFVAWKAAPDEILLACHASVLASTLKRLSMFVLRAKCKLIDATADVPLVGLAGSAVPGDAATLPAWRRMDIDAGALVRLPDGAGVPRALLASTHQAPAGDSLSLDAWRWLELQSGVPVIEASTAEHFVPQMLNLELVGGVHLQKGCYPGQEIVARAQYRGTVKRRMFLFDVDAAAAPAQEVFHSGDPGQPAGMVVNAAPRVGAAGCALLAEVKLAALDGGSLHLGTPQGPVLQRRDLPYAVPIDIHRAA